MRQTIQNKRKFWVALYPVFSYLVILLAGILLVIWPKIAFPQITKILGQVIDSTTQEPIPFANIIILKTLQGTLTDFEGNFSFELKDTEADSIRASLLGYQPQTKPIIKGKFQRMDFGLSSQDQDLPEVVILYTGNPADAIIDSIIEHKERNSFQSFESYQYDAYTKIQIDANNVTERLINRKIMKPFNFILDYVDTSTINGKSYLPVMISETMSVIYERRFPKSKKEIIKASQISGLDNTNLTQFLGSRTQEVDIYSNFTEIVQKNFVSPIADFGHDYYKYYLVDSAFIKNYWCYHIMFKPKRKQELTYTGSLWVNDTTYAVVKIQMRIADDANLNFVNDMEVEQEYDWTDDQLWMRTKDRIVVDFNIVENVNKVVGIYAQRTIFRDNFKFDDLDNNDVFKLPADVTLEETANKYDENYWDSIRPEMLSKTEDGIYEMIDSIKKVPQFKKYRNIGYALATGYIPWGKVEIGPYFKFFSYNAVEGARFRLGGRTSANFSRKLRLEAYLAYGTKDERFKYGGELIYLFRKDPRRRFKVFYKYDLEQLGLSETARGTDNLLSSFFSRGPIDKLTMVRQYKMTYDHEYFNGLINTFVINRRELFPLGDTKFLIFPDSRLDTVYASSITTTEIGLDTRISFNETYTYGKFSRVTLSSELPVIMIRYRFGIPALFTNDYDYHKLNIGIEQWFNLGTIGWSRFYVDFGKIWGTLPYPLLKIHAANQTWLYDRYSSNLMNYYEFVSDQYVILYYTHHFDGLLFNKIPLFRKLKWREVIQFRGVYGSLTEKNLEFSEFPGYLRPLGTEPYLETGVAIENILKVIRIDAIWRLTHLNDPGGEQASKFGIFASLYFSF